MSSNIQVLKVCDFCKKEFIAKKTTSKTCSDNCAKRLYKLKKKNDTIALVQIGTAVEQKPKATVSEDDVKTIQAKQYLTLKEAALLLNVFSFNFKKTDSER